MARMNDFFANVKKGLGNLGNKVEKAADNTSLRIKLTAVESKLNDLYTEFGQLTYESMKNGATEERQKQLETLLAMIDGKAAEKRSIEDELARRKEEAAQVKTEHEAAAEPAEEVPDTEEKPE